MVNAALKYEPLEVESPKNPLFLPSPLRYGTVSIAQMVNNGHRYDASAYNIGATNALRKVKRNKYGYVYLWGDKGFVIDSYYGPRGKRAYIQNTPNSLGFIGSSEMLEINPKPVKFVPIGYRDTFGVAYGDVLVSRSGTIGNVSYVTKTLQRLCVSEHAIRISCSEYSGYVYAFLATEVGRLIIQSFTFGAVVDQIEPIHLKQVPIPNAPKELKESIHNLIVESYDLRDKSNDLIDEAQELLYKELQLPDISTIKGMNYAENKGFQNYVVKASQLNGRLDGSYHIPEVEEVIKVISKNAAEVTTLGDPRLSKKIILAGVFKRTYVDKQNGVPFLGGRDIMQLNPSIEKYLSIAVHKERIEKELEVFNNYILVTDRGTIGKIQIVPKHWNGWAVSQNVIKVVPASIDISGYLYAYLATDFANVLIKRETYGSVVDMIDNNNVASIVVPLLKDKSVQQKINDLVLEANELRYQAYLKEQEGINKMNEIINN